MRPRTGRYAFRPATKKVVIHIVIDGFGTGYSSLNRLTHLPLDALKIDRSFVRNMQASGHDLAVIRAIIAMGRNLGLATIAEGVETGEQLDVLRAEHCDGIQGNLVSPPVSAAEISRLLGSERDVLQRVLAPPPSR